MHSVFQILAQEAPAAPTPRPPGASAFFLPALLVAVFVFMLLSARSQKKREEREREQMFAGLARGDRVLTAGGIVGTVMSIRDNEVVLKVDESTNTKVTFVKSAVQRVLKDDEALESTR